MFHKYLQYEYFGRYIYPAIKSETTLSEEVSIVFGRLFRTTTRCATSDTHNTSFICLYVCICTYYILHTCELIYLCKYWNIKNVSSQTNTNYSYYSSVFPAKLRSNLCRYVWMYVYIYIAALDAAALYNLLSFCTLFDIAHFLVDHNTTSAHRHYTNASKVLEKTPTYICMYVYVYICTHLHA